ncbi:MAG TPA: nucleoside hydrolase [Aggregatilineales bacterium]|nr:nucleoside hydrolase [Aggregatilineales bacterium]
MERVILDCDNTLGLPLKEIDDGLALLYLLGCDDIELLGVTTTFGNGTAEQATGQTRWLLDEIGRSEIPVLQGEAARHRPPTEAAEFLAAVAAEHPGQITVLATGPLGNLHAAAKLDPAFFHNVKRIACMGGMRQPLRLGWRSLPELNLSANPEAAASVLAAPCPVTLMSAEICLQAAFNWRDLRHIRGWRPVFRRTVRRWLLAFGAYTGELRFYLWDLVPAVFITHPELFSGEQVQLDLHAAKLEQGALAPAGGDAGAAVTLPSTITDAGRFRSVLFDTWARVAG